MVDRDLDWPGSESPEHLPPTTIRVDDHDQDPQATALKVNAARLFDEKLHLLISKNQDYSPMNISQAPFGVMEGLLTRISDKFYRAINLVEKGGEAQYESLEDTFGDLMGYAAISVLCLRGQWPGVGKGGVR